MSANEAYIAHDMQLVVDMPPEDILFSFSALTAFSGNDPEAACSITRIFIEEIGKSTDRMQQALTDREMDGIVAMAYELLPLFTLIEASGSVAPLRWLGSCRGEELSEEIEKTMLKTLEMMRKIVHAVEEYNFGLHQISLGSSFGTAYIVPCLCHPVGTVVLEACRSHATAVAQAYQRNGTGISS